MADIIIGRENLGLFLESHSTSTIGVCTAGIKTGPEDANGIRNKISQNALYTLVKAKSVEDITICCPMETYNTFAPSAMGTLSTMVANVTENISDFISDYVYIDDVQHTATNILDRLNFVLNPFLEYESTCQITRYLPYNIPFPWIGIQRVTIDIQRRKYTSSCLHFNYILKTEPVLSTKNQLAKNTLKNLDVAHLSLNQVTSALNQYSPYPYIMVNTHGQTPSLDDLRNGKVVIYFFRSEAEKNVQTPFVGSYGFFFHYWMGFGYGDLYNSQTDSMEKNVCDSDIDAVLDAKWDNASFDYTLFYPNYGEFREDIIAYYRGKYPAV